MSTNEFDRLLNERFDRHEFAYDPAGWERLARQLPQEKSRRIIPFVWWKTAGMAAALVVMISGAAWYFQSQDKPTAPIASQQSVLQQYNTQIQPAFLPASASEDSHIQGEQPTPSVHHSVAVMHKPSERNTTSVNVAHREQLIPSTELIASSAVVITPEQTETNEEIKPEAKKSEPAKPKKDKPFTMASLTPDPDAYEPVSRPSGKTLLSLTGGMNYGSMNTGYMAGVNAKQKIGKKLFVEGDFAVVNNTASQTFTQQQKQLGISSKMPINYRDANLLYVAFNPTVGYQVLPKVSVGVGADVQRMVNGDDILVMVDETEKTIPGTDVGLTGKTEVSISRRLRAGVLYREGINNFINSSSDFFDRRYLQVQLKFTVLGK